MKGIIYFFSAKLFVYLSTLHPAHLFAMRESLQKWEGGITGDFRYPNFPTL